jgi:NifB/MoaA-like Fe-S oxidoreductase
MVHRPQRTLAVSGRLIEPLLGPMIVEFARLTGCHVELVAIDNSFFGGNVGVSGLLTGGLVVEALRTRKGCDLVFLPRAMLDSSGERFLDNMLPGQLEDELGCPVRFVEKMSDMARILGAAASQRTAIPE